MLLLNLSKEPFTSIFVHPNCSLDFELSSLALREMVNCLGTQRFTALESWTYVCLKSPELNGHSRSRSPLTYGVFCKQSPSWVPQACTGSSHILFPATPWRQRGQGCGNIPSKRKCRLKLGQRNEKKALDREILWIENQETFWWVGIVSKGDSKNK